MEELLVQMGLSEYEARIYAVLLAHSPCSASVIAKKCALSRSSVYTTLSTLTSKGLVGTTYKNEVKQFVSQGIDGLEHLLKKEKQDLETKQNVLRAFEKNFGTAFSPLSHVPRIIFFEGKEGLQKIYKSMLWNAPDHSTMYIMRDEFVWSKEWDFVFKAEWHNSVKELRKKKNIVTHLLVNDSPLERKKASFYTTRKGLKYKYLPTTNTVHSFAVYIIHDEVSILSLENNNLVGIRITNKNIADNFVSVFKNMWKK